jgi:hypothetical protein
MRSPRPMKKMECLSPLPLRYIGMSRASSWPTLHSVSLPTGAGKSNSVKTASGSLRSSLPSRKTYGGGRHSSMIVST